MDQLMERLRTEVNNNFTDGSEYKRLVMANYFENFAIEPEFRENVRRLWEYIAVNNDPRNPTRSPEFYRDDGDLIKYFQFDNSDGVNIDQQLFQDIMNLFFPVGWTGANLHNIMHAEEYCSEDEDYRIDNTYEEQKRRDDNIDHMIKKIGDYPGKTNDCNIRLKSVKIIQRQPVNIGIKRLTRFNIKCKTNTNYYGSGCYNKNITDVFRGDNKDECEFKELFTGILMSKYLRKVYGNIIPKYYGLITVKKHNLRPGDKITHEIYCVYEAMNKTYQDWIQEYDEDSYKSLLTLDELKTFLIRNNFLYDCLNFLPIHNLYIREFSYIFQNYFINNVLPASIYSVFYDCKVDNIMIDNNNIWRIIDIDGLRYTDERILKNDEHPSICLASGHDYLEVPEKKQIYNIISFIDDSNDVKILNILKNAIIDVRDNSLQLMYKNTRLHEIREKYVDMVHSYDALTQGSNNRYYKKYLKYKAKYMKLKNML